MRHPRDERRAVYRARVCEVPDRPGFDPVNVLALTSPIYAEDIAQDLLLENPDLEPAQAWIDIRRAREELATPGAWMFSNKAPFLRFARGIAHEI